jgi:hypothetical protein
MTADTLPTIPYCPSVGEVVRVEAVDPQDNDPRVVIGEIVEVAVTATSPRIPEYIYLRATKNRLGEGTWCRVTRVRASLATSEGVNAELELIASTLVEDYAKLGETVNRLILLTGQLLNEQAKERQQQQR